MFRHIFLHRLKCSLRDRQMLFWTFFFPILLATFFGLAFSNLNSGEIFSSIPVSVIDNEAYQADLFLQTTLQAASDQLQPERLFDLQELTLEQADQALREGNIAGYLLPGESLGIVVADTGIRQTILKIFADEYLQIAAAVHTIADINPAAMATIFERIGQRMDLLREEQAGRGGINDIVIYYYALIGMACLYGGFYGMREIIAVQANLSSQAARINLVPVHKMKIFAASLTAAFCVQYSSILLLVAYLVFVQRIDFGHQTGLILLICLTGSLLGIMIGALIGAIGKSSEGIKNAILIGVSMVFSFLAGLMQTSIKYLVDSKVPVLQWLNPANLVCDSLYALYYYDNLTRYMTNILIQSAMIVVLFLIVYFILRRQRYASL